MSSSASTTAWLAQEEEEEHETTTSSGGKSGKRGFGARRRRCLAPLLQKTAAAATRGRRHNNNINNNRKNPPQPLPPPVSAADVRTCWTSTTTTSSLTLIETTTTKSPYKEIIRSNSSTSAPPQRPLQPTTTSNPHTEEGEPATTTNTETGGSRRGRSTSLWSKNKQGLLFVDSSELLSSSSAVPQQPAPARGLSSSSSSSALTRGRGASSLLLSSSGRDPSTRQRNRLLVATTAAAVVGSGTSEQESHDVSSNSSITRSSSCRRNRRLGGGAAAAAVSSQQTGASGSGAWLTARTSAARTLLLLNRRGGGSSDAALSFSAIRTGGGGPAAVQQPPEEQQEGGETATRTTCEEQQSALPRQRRVSFSSPKNKRGWSFVNRSMRSCSGSTTTTTAGGGRAPPPPPLALTSSSSSRGQQQRQQKLEDFSSSSKRWSSFASRSMRSMRSSGTTTTTIAPSSRGPQQQQQSSNPRLEEFTMDKLRFHQVGLVGRDTELQRVRDVFHATMAGITTTTTTSGGGGTAAAAGGRNNTITSSSSSSQLQQLPRRSLLLIAGAAGTGKSSVAQQALEPLCRKHKAFLLRGKHKQQQQGSDRPYAGLVACCEELCHQVISTLRHPDDLQVLQARLQQELETTEAAQMVTSIFPSLIPLIGCGGGGDPTPTPHESSLPSNENDNKHAATNNNSNGTLAQLNRTASCNSIICGTTALQHNSSGEARYMEARLRFFNAFRRVMRVICIVPTVLLIDDLQWCDGPSFELLEVLLKDTKLSQLVIVGTYRPEALTEDQHKLPHMLSNFIDQIKAVSTEATEASHRVNLDTIHVGNLDVQSIVDLLVELLSTNADHARPLAQCIHGKTHGNAFFTVQFLTCLQQRGLLTFNYGSFTWIWNVAHIDHEMVSTENVAHLMRARMQVLPAHLQHVLPLLASLGSIFDMDLFEMVMHHVRTNSTSGGQETSGKDDKDRKTVQKSNEKILKALVEEGLLESFGAASYRWIHDKVEEAALTLIPEEELDTLQFDFATSLLEQMDDLQKRDHVFILVHLFRTGHQRLPATDHHRRLEIAQLRLESGVQAFHASAFGQAARELEYGIELLSSFAMSSWKMDYDLCLDLYSTAAEANLCIGEWPLVEEYVSVVLKETREKPLLDKRRAYNALLRSHFAAGRLDLATPLVLDVLSQLGVTFGKQEGIPRVISKKLSYARNNVASIAQRLSALAPLRDDAEAWLIFLLDRLFICWYQSNSPMLPLANLTGLERILEAGITEITPNIVAGVGLLCSVSLQDHEAARLYALQALDLVNRMNSKYSEAQTCLLAYHFILHHTTPVEDLRKGLFQGYRSGMANGESEFACWCINGHLEQSFIGGASLDYLISMCQVHVQEARELHQLPQVSIMSCVWQLALNLMGKSEDPLVLTGEAMSEDDWLDNFWSPHAHLQFGRYQVHLAILFGSYERAMELIMKYNFHQRSYENAFPGNSPVCLLYFHCAIAAASMARQPKRKSHYRKLMSKFAQEVLTWAENKNPNAKHHAALLTAELEDLKGNTGKAKEWYERAIALSARRGFRHDRALAHERCGDFHLRQNDASSAKHHFHEAIAVLEDWGAVAKVEHLRQQHPDILALPREISIIPSSG